ncbi:hypothetical protein E2C01_079719 [Portunus trituberculatus]|uniref:Uncharacterized protein n=1 Tax=Portunus trituberculatus TaxID=210409 RepID=A0A5B7IXR6_PORTR|nr:hypothetical protein [Portunus trituberculatus]
MPTEALLPPGCGSPGVYRGVTWVMIGCYESSRSLHDVGEEERAEGGREGRESLRDNHIVKSFIVPCMWERGGKIRKRGEVQEGERKSVKGHVVVKFGSE